MRVAKWKWKMGVNVIDNFQAACITKTDSNHTNKAKMISMPNELESLESLMKLTMQSTIVQMIPVCQ
jgi:hypothetical protein